MWIYIFTLYTNTCRLTVSRLWCISDFPFWLSHHPTNLFSEPIKLQFFSESNEILLRKPDEVGLPIISRVISQLTGVIHNPSYPSLFGHFIGFFSLHLYILYVLFNWCCLGFNLSWGDDLSWQRNYSIGMKLEILISLHVVFPSTVIGLPVLR